MTNQELRTAVTNARLALTAMDEAQAKLVAARNGLADQLAKIEAAAFHPWHRGTETLDTDFEI